MPEKEFEIWLDDVTRLLIRRETDRGHLVDFAVILVALIDGRWVDIGRFDSAHGLPHEDVLGRRAGLIEKIWYDETSGREVFQLAIQRYREEYESIKERFLKH